MRQVLNEFAPLIKKSRVVFIAFDDERATHVPRVCGIREVAGDAADKPARVGTISLEQDRGHASGGRLTVRAGDDDIATLVQQAGAEKFRKRDVRLGARLQQPFHFRVSTGGDVTDDDQIWLQLCETLGRPALQDVDARTAEVIGHRRIDTCIGAHDLMPLGAHQQGGVTHRRAADAHEIDAHRADKSPRGPEGEKVSG